MHTAIIMAVLGGVLAAFVGELAAAPLLGALHTPEEVFPLSLLYLRIYFAGGLYPAGHADDRSRVQPIYYEVLSGYLRGFGISLLPAVLTMAGVCGIRLSWIYWVFPKNPTFRTIMMAFPISLEATVLLMLIAVLYCRPSQRFSAAQEHQREGTEGV